MRVAAALEELGRGLLLSRASAVPPPKLRRRQVADWVTGISPIISVLPGHPTESGPMTRRIDFVSQMQTSGLWRVSHSGEDVFDNTDYFRVARCPSVVSIHTALRT